MKAKRPVDPRHDRRPREPPAAKWQPNRLLAAFLPPTTPDRSDRSTLSRSSSKTFFTGPVNGFEHVYFPGGGFCSLLTVLEDGAMVEVATIGREGMLGVFAAIGRHAPPSVRPMVQAETATCYRMTVDAFRTEMDRRGAFYDLLTRFAQALVGFIMQSTACNAVHSVEQRLARWLLMAQTASARTISTDAGIRRDDARRDAPDRDGCRRDLSEGRSDHVPPWPRDDPGSRKARSGLLRMLPGSDESAAGRDSRTDLNADG